MFVPQVRLFPITLLACEFNLHRQTWYQKFTKTYLPLEEDPSVTKTQGN